MFYCNACGRERGWPINTPVQSHGRCELCTKPGSCNDVPSSRLPIPVEEPETAKQVYSIDIKICATAYIVAESLEEAQDLANDLEDKGIELSSRYQPIGDDMCIDGSSYEALAENDERVALSPAMTIHGLWTKSDTVELVEAIEGDV